LSKGVSKVSEALELSAVIAPLPRTVRLPEVCDLLTEGGDGRISLDGTYGRNKYGCAPRPEPALIDFGSSTASTISLRGWAAVTDLRERLMVEAGRMSQTALYARELERLRGELIALCGLGDIPGLDVVFAASGTDIHMLAGALVGGTPNRPLVCIDVEANETGSGVPAALGGRHFSSRTALGAEVIDGAHAGPAGLFVPIAARGPDGLLRDGADIEAELDEVILAATQSGRRVLLTVADVSKTGLISPSLSTVLALQRRFPKTLEVMVDACQLRLSPDSLGAYLAQGFMVAVTGSKFLTGPTFSGALFVPQAVCERLKGRLLPPALRAYSARAEWPKAWVAGASMNEAANFGLLLRWEAALEELRAFAAVPAAEVETFVRSFADAVCGRLADDPAFEPLPTRALDRAAVGVVAGWDRTATIFPFLLKGRDGYLDAKASAAVYRSLSESAGVRLGQPVACGAREGRPIAALRLCNSARLIVEAANDPARVIDRALKVLDVTAEAARAAT
jgi:hypothetical protein